MEGRTRGSWEARGWCDGSTVHLTRRCFAFPLLPSMCSRRHDREGGTSLDSERAHLPLSLDRGQGVGELTSAGLLEAMGPWRASATISDHLIQPLLLQIGKPRCQIKKLMGANWNGIPVYLTPKPMSLVLPCPSIVHLHVTSAGVGEAPTRTQKLPSGVRRDQSRWESAQRSPGTSLVQQAWVLQAPHLQEGTRPPIIVPGAPCILIHREERRGRSSETLAFMSSAPPKNCCPISACGETPSTAG